MDDREHIIRESALWAMENHFDELADHLDLDEEHLGTVQTKLAQDLA